jgi:hypothetical protein
MMILSPKDWTLLTIAAAKGEPLSPVQLQKSLFLISQNLTAAQRKCKQFYEFKPYDYGPFSAAIYSDANILELERLVEISMQVASHRVYIATIAGIARAAELRSGLDEVAVKYLDAVVSWARHNSFETLIKSIYKTYPEMRRNSIFRQ